MEIKDFNIDFIGIGSGKCGSTWLYSNIIKHPEICNKNPKEIRFFDLHYSKGIKWYRKQFSGCGKLLKGEFSVQYMYHPETANRIKKHFPNVKLITILRKPEERIFSDYLHSIRKADISPKMTFSEYIKDENNLKYGLYYKYLLPFFNEFPTGNIKVILLEEVMIDSKMVLKDIYKFLGVVNKEFLPNDLNKKLNVAMEYKILFIENMITNISRFLNNIGFTLFVERIKRLGLPAMIRKLNTKEENKKIMDKASKVFLKEYFYYSNQKLADLIKKDLYLWE